MASIYNQPLLGLTGEDIETCAKMDMLLEEIQNLSNGHDYNIISYYQDEIDHIDIERMRNALEVLLTGETHLLEFEVKEW